MNEGRPFAGFNSEFERSAYIIAGIPFDKTSSFRTGSWKGPDEIRDASYCFEPYLMEHEVLLDDIDLCDYGDISRSDDFNDLSEDIKKLGSYIVKEEKFPIFLGGEHSISAPIVPRLPINKAFKVADEVLMRAIKGMTEIITKPGLVNLDYNDLRTIMESAGQAMIGMGESSAGGDKRAEEAIDEAINSPLLDVDMSGASGVLINVTGSEDMSVHEAEMVAESVEKKAGKGANIIWGASVDPTLEDTIKVMIVATGVESKQIIGAEETPGKEGIEEVA